MLPSPTSPKSYPRGPISQQNPRSVPLARLVQAQLVRRLGQRDLGIHYQNLAVARPPWMPAVLTEGLFLMIPEQEAALRARANPFTCGGPALHYQSSLDEDRLNDWLIDHGLTPPGRTA